MSKGVGFEPLPRSPAVVDCRDTSGPRSSASCRSPAGDPITSTLSTFAPFDEAVALPMPARLRRGRSMMKAITLRARYPQQSSMIGQHRAPISTTPAGPAVVGRMAAVTGRGEPGADQQNAYSPQNKAQRGRGGGAIASAPQALIRWTTAVGLRLAEHDHLAWSTCAVHRPRPWPKGPRKGEDDPRLALFADQNPPMRLANWRAIASPSPVPPAGGWPIRRPARSVEDVLLRAQRDADAGIAHVDAQHHPVRPGSPRPTPRS